MRILLLLASFLSLNAYGQQTWNSYKRCYAELDACVVTLADDDGTIDSIFLDAADNITPDAAIVQEYRDIGIELKVLDSNTFAKAAKAATNTADVPDLEEEITLLVSIPDEQWAAYTEASLCVATLAGCGYGVFSTFVTGGGALFLARVSCAASLISCVSAIRTWNKWENYQRRKRNEEKIKNAQKQPQPGQSSGSSSGPISPGIGTGGAGTPIGTGSKDGKGTVEVYDPETGTWW